MVEKLPEELFKNTFEYVPRVAINIIVTNDANEVLLTKRAIPPMKDFWHYPGSFLLKDETLEDCIKRISKDELGMEIDPKKGTLLGVFENISSDTRGHVIDILYKFIVDKIDLTSTAETQAMQFFSHLPENIGFNHREVLEKVGFS